MAHEEPQASLLLQLPDPCLLLVLQSLAGNPASLCSAARAHSRLHQAAVMTLTSISAKITSQEQVDGSLLPYLSKHGQHTCSMRLQCVERVEKLRQLPVQSMAQLTYLDLSHFELQLQAGGGVQGVLGAARLPLTQLRLSFCVVLDGFQGMAAALSLLPRLEHLDVNMLEAQDSSYFTSEVFTPATLQHLQQLTYVAVAGVRDDYPAPLVLQPLQALTRLAHLQMDGTSFPATGQYPLQIENDTLLSSHHLTHLELPWGVLFDSGVLAGKTRLHHFSLPQGRITGGAAGVAQLLSGLQHMQQLTHLVLTNAWDAVMRGTPLQQHEGHSPAAAFSALTASSKLQLLDISRCTLPVGAWQHMFPVGRQLPHLLSLDISWVEDQSGGGADAPEGSRLACCCPSLQSLHMEGLECRAGQLLALSELSGLSQLHVTLDQVGLTDLRMRDCRHLTGLRELHIDSQGDSYADEVGLLLQLTHLWQLTHLSFTAHNWDPAQVQCEDEGSVMCRLEQVGADDEPVWRQLLQHYLDHPDPYIADEALEGLHSSSDSDSYDKSVDCGPWVELHRSLMNLHK